MLAGEAAALVTAPIHKEALAAAGIAYPGHTEMLQALAAPGRAAAGAHDAGQRRAAAVLVTIHLALRRAIDAVTFDAVLETIRIAARGRAALRRGARRASRSPGSIRTPARAACSATRSCASSPRRCRRRAPRASTRSGPFAPDTVFMRARHAPDHPGEFDLVVAMTHDHGLIPVKYLGVEHGVNVTLGLPFVRTSPDHGTAFDIAGTRPRRPGEPRGGGAHGAHARRGGPATLSAGRRARARPAASAPAASRAPSGRRSRRRASARSRTCAQHAGGHRDRLLVLAAAREDEEAAARADVRERTFCHSSFRCIW